MPLDQAVYVPDVGGRGDYIAGVRGGYLFKYSAVTGLRILGQTLRFAVPPLSDASIVYDSISDNLFVSRWNDPASGNDTASPTLPISQGFYKINPTSFTTTTFWAIKTIAPNTYDKLFNGPHRIIIDVGNIYGLVWTDVAAEVFKFTPATVSFVLTNSHDNVHGGYGGMAINTFLGSPELWVAAPDDVNIHRLVLSAIVPGYNPAPNIDTHNFPVFDLCIVPSTGIGYGSTKSGRIRKFDTGGIITDLTAAGTNPYILCIRYNPINGLIYAPDVQNNLINVINPVDDSIVQKTGSFDSPFDVVFTPTKTFAVQLGLTGLKEVV